MLILYTLLIKLILFYQCQYFYIRLKFLKNEISYFLHYTLLYHLVNN